MAFYPVDGLTSVTTSGTAVPLSTYTGTVSQLFIQALHGNTGVIAVGAQATVKASATAGSGTQLLHDGTFTLHDVRPCDIWLDAAVSGESVNWNYFQSTPISS
jgi:hypothetical protein